MVDFVVVNGFAVAGTAFSDSAGRLRVMYVLIVGFLVIAVEEVAVEGAWAGFVADVVMVAVAEDTEAGFVVVVAVVAAEDTGAGFVVDEDAIAGSVVSRSTLIWFGLENAENLERVER